MKADLATILKQQYAIEPTASNPSLRFSALTGQGGEIMRFYMRFLSAAVAVGLSVPLGALSSSAQDASSRGEYLARIMDCGGCHTPGALAGRPDQARYLNGGDIGFGIPGLGTFYPPNLTPDQETGLGAWTEADIIRAVRTGVRPDGRELAPVMPWHAYSALTDGDAAALASYIKSLPPARNAVPPPQGPSDSPPAPYLSVVAPKG